LDPHLPQLITTLAPQLSALRAAFLVASHHGVNMAPEDLPRIVEGDLAPSMTAALQKAGFRTSVLDKCPWSTASRLGSAYPAIAGMKDGRWVILVHVMTTEAGEAAAIVDPSREAEGMKLVLRGAFEADWAGRLILARPNRQTRAGLGGFGLNWFLPELLTQRHLLAGVATAVLLANMISFAIPLLLQVLIDRVISYQAVNTLVVVVSVYVLLSVFDAAFSYVRQRLMMIAGARVDARLGARVFTHLMALPLSVFETTAAGVLTRHMQQTEKIRQFLTGRLFQTLLDAAFLPVLVTLLALYSGTLTLIVVGFAVSIAACIAALMPLFRRRLTALYTAEAARQAHLVETLHNMRAVKALVLEPARRGIWENNLAAALRRQLDVGGVSALASAVTGLLEKLMQVTVIGVGALLVFDGGLSIGALVAFLMLSGRVTGPLVQIVGLVSEYQEAALSVRMLAGVMDVPPERGPAARPARPMVQGHLTFDQVSFTYKGARSPALDRVSFDLSPGMVLGVMGRSGSGKTTLTRLIQGIEQPQSGLIQIDGVDIRHIDLAHLRRNVGVVLQENLLFTGSIRDNIAAAHPEAGMDEVVAAARLAGAEEFIRRLPASFDTRVEEGGANLSGGQRQRLAIARALITAPRMLVFDEATSALDPESEAVVNRNLAAIAQGRTVIIVSHRLSSLVRADAIMVLDEGRVLDIAPHQVLLGRCETYSSLWRQQTEHLA
jgi:ATP-binding cassette subfamily B protein